MLDIATQLDENSRPIFNELQLEQILMSRVNNLSVEDIKKYANPIFNHNQMESISDMIELYYRRNKLEKYKKGIELIIHLKKNGKPSFNASQMKCIFLGFLNNLDYDQVSIYAQLDKNEKPIYVHSRMDALITGLVYGLSGKRLEFCLEKINQKNSKGKYIFDKYQASQIINELSVQLKKATKKSESQAIKRINLYSAIKNETPVFSAEQMRVISDYCKRVDFEVMKSVVKAGDYAVSKIDYKDMYHIFNTLILSEKENAKIITEAIADGFTFDKLSVLLDDRGFLSAREQRVFKNLLNDKSDFKALKLIKDNLQKVPIKNRYTYIRECKYYLQCAKFFDIPEISIASHLYLDDMKSELLNSLSLDKEISDILSLCLDYKMPPEQIKFINDSVFKASEARNIAMALLSGASFDKFKNNHELAQDVLNDTKVASDIAKDFDLYTVHLDFPEL